MPIFFPTSIRLIFYISFLSLSSFSFNSLYCFSLLINNRHKVFRLISLFIKTSDILLFILFNLLLANITILLSFSSYSLLFLTVFFTIPIEIGNARLRLALTIPADAQITVANDAIECCQLLQIKQWMTCKSGQKNQYIYSY